MVVFAIIGLYLVVILYFSINQARFIYIPYREMTGTPADFGLYFEEVNLETEDSIELSAWFIPAENSRGTVLFCHGNAGNISHRSETIRIINELGLSLLIFDYRGYGESEGKPLENGLYLDAEAAWDYLLNERGNDPSEIILWGRSLGGSVAAWLANERKSGVLILESSFTSVPDLASELYPFLPVKLLARFRHNTREYVKDAQCPVLVIHSKDDDIIPFHHGRELYEAANEPKEFLQISGDHNSGFAQDQDIYQQAINKFINKYFKINPNENGGK
ncbi:alpha/beta hydrolase [bacterium]|nr:alpha/beta hydrolase [bacterium]